jgi:hypothetical protein
MPLLRNREAPTKETQDEEPRPRGAHLHTSCFLGKNSRFSEEAILRIDALNFSMKLFQFK